MKAIWIAITMILGLVMFMLVKQYFILAVVYVVAHISIITWLKHRGVLNLKAPTFLIILLFLIPQLLFSLGIHFDLPNHGFDAENYDKALKFNLLRTGILIVEFILLFEFFKRPKFNRY